MTNLRKEIELLEAQIRHADLKLKRLAVLQSVATTPAEFHRLALEISNTRLASIKLMTQIQKLLLEEDAEAAREVYPLYKKIFDKLKALLSWIGII